MAKPGHPEGDSSSALPALGAWARSTRPRRPPSARATASAIADHAAAPKGWQAGHREGLEAGRREALDENAARVSRLDALLCALTADITRARCGARPRSRAARPRPSRARSSARRSRCSPEMVLHAVEEALRQVGQRSRRNPGPRPSRRRVHRGAPSSRARRARARGRSGKTRRSLAAAAASISSGSEIDATTRAPLAAHHRRAGQAAQDWVG